MTQQIEADVTVQPERYLLSAILADPAQIWTVRQSVRVDDFDHTSNAHVFEAMCAVADGGQLPSVVLVADELGRLGGPHAASVAHAYGLDDASVMGVQAHEFARVVHDHGKRRRLAEASEHIAEVARAGGKNVIEEAAAIIDRLRVDVLSETRQIGEAFQDLIDTMKTQQPYTPTPWPSLNEAIGGVRPGAMYTVAGATGGGKSVFGLQLATHLAERGKRVGYVSLEMGELQLLKRMLSMMQGIHQSALNNHQLTPEGWAALFAAETALKTIPLEVYDRRPATFADVSGFIRALHRKGDLGAIVIDYLGLLDSPKGARASDRSAILNDYANGFKALATELDIAIIVLEQLNRDSAGRKTPRPVITDIRGTAALEHAADVVVLLHRPTKRHGGKDLPTRDIEFIVAKNRQGEQGVKLLWFDGKHSRVLETSYVSTPLIGQEEV